MDVLGKKLSFTPSSRRRLLQMTKLLLRQKKTDLFKKHDIHLQFKEARNELSYADAFFNAKLFLKTKFLRILCAAVAFNK